METGEVQFDSKKDKDESGFSEKKLDQSTDLLAGQWIDLSNSGGNRKTSPAASVKNQPSSPVLQQQSLETFKILSGYVEDLAARLSENVAKYIVLVGKNDESLTVLKEIDTLQSRLKTMLRALSYEKKGTLDVQKLPKEAQDLLK